MRVTQQEWALKPRENQNIHIHDCYDLTLHGRNTNNDREVNALHILNRLHVKLKSTEISSNRASIPDRDTG